MLGGGAYAAGIVEAAVVAIIVLGVSGCTLWPTCVAANNSWPHMPQSQLAGGIKCSCSCSCCCCSSDSRFNLPLEQLSHSVIEFYAAV